MKNLTIILTMLFSISAFAGGEWKEVCHDRLDKAGKVVKDKKGNAVKDCKKIKVHKKLNGTVVPTKK